MGTNHTTYVRWFADLGICSQAPSDYPEVAECLVEIGIDSISLNPDTLLKTTRHVLGVEKRLGRDPR